MANTPIQTDINTATSYLKTHERLIVTIIVALVITLGYYKAISYLAARDQINSNKEQVVLQAQVEANKQSAAQSQQIALQYQQLAAQLVAANIQIAAAQAQRAKATLQQQTVDRNLPPSQLADRWTTLTKSSPNSVQPNAGGYQVSPASATETVVQLETISQLQGDLAGQQTVAANESKQIDGLNGVVVSQQTQIVGLGVQIQDQTKVCAAQITTIKAQNRKSKFKWFVTGYVGGLLTRGAIKLFAGI